MAKKIKVSRKDIIQFKISYDAEKLAKKLPDIIFDFVGDYSKNTAKGSISNIKNNKVKPSTSDKFKKVRKSLGFSATPTLLMTGKLVKSIKSKKLKRQANLTMKEYGWFHHTGAGSNKERPFIGIDKKWLDRIVKKFKKNLRKSFKGK
tara:strand:- start:181 stop:624 length:444 start_codon:yes stop_codon:yes gene_type:complete